MAYAPPQLGQDPKFDPFLYAPLGEDQRGSSVTVLSMLARLGIDPWREASELSKLPEAAARVRLDAVLARFHDVSSPITDRGKTVRKLLAFLPRAAPSARSSAATGSDGLAFPQLGAWFYWIVAATLFLGWIANLAQVD